MWNQHEVWFHFNFADSFQVVGCEEQKVMGCVESESSQTSSPSHPSKLKDFQPSLASEWNSLGVRPSRAPSGLTRRAVDPAKPRRSWPSRYLRLLHVPYALCGTRIDTIIWVCYRTYLGNERVHNTPYRTRLNEFLATEYPIRSIVCPGFVMILHHHHSLLHPFMHVVGFRTSHTIECTFLCKFNPYCALVVLYPCVSISIQ